MNYLEQIPDTIKVGTAVTAPVLTMLGITVEEWTFILSGIVSLLFIFEKLPTLIRKAVQFIKELRNATRNE